MTSRLKLRLNHSLSTGLGLAFAVAAGSLAGISAASAQAVVVGPGGYFSPAQRQYIQTYVVRHPVPPAAIPGGFVPAVGAIVPPGVPLQPFAVAPSYPQRYATYTQGYYGPGYYGQVYYGQIPPDQGGYGVAGYDTQVYPGELYGGGYSGGGGGYDLSGYRYVTFPGYDAAVVEPRTRRIIMIIE